MDEDNEKQVTKWDYPMTAKYTVKRLGGDERVKSKIKESRKDFMILLEDCIFRWWDEPCDKELLYNAIIDALENPQSPESIIR